MRKIDEIKADITACDKCDWPDCSVKGGREENTFGCCPTCEAIYKSNKVDFVNELIRAITDGIPLDRLEAICTAERDGRCVVLPCKVGDTVYKLWYKPCHHGNTYPDGMDCCGCEDECDIERAVIPFTANSFEHIVGMMGSFNRLWFLTPESAEEALRKERI